MTDFSKMATPGLQVLQPYQPGKPIEELEREYGISNTIKLASNESPAGPSPAALEAAHGALQEIRLYPDGNGFMLKERLARYHGVSTGQITLGNGSSEVLELLLRVFVTPQDEVLFSQHAFALYPLLTLAASATPVAAPAKDWGHDLDEMRRLVNERTRVVFIANPNNPTGTWLAQGELRSFIEDLPSTTIVVLDEAYYDYAASMQGGDGGYPNALQWCDSYPNLMITRTFSKAYGLAGLRVGYAISDPQIADLMNRIRPPFNVNSVAMAAATAAIDDQLYLAKVIEDNSSGLQQLADAFHEMGRPYIPSIGNFIAVDVGRPGMEVYQRLLTEGVIVRPIGNYEMPNHLRITVGSCAENGRVIEALKRVLNGIN